MKVTLFMASSLNGFVALENGSEEFLDDEHWKEFSTLVHSYQNVIVGRKTYETVKQWSEYGFSDFKQAVKIIISKNKDYLLDKEYALALSPAKALSLLEEKGFTKALLAGGPCLVESFIKEGLLDEIILNIEPVLVKKGIFLFVDGECELDLLETKNVTSNIVQLRYRVKK